MGYTHFGKQAEVWKHVALSEIILIESPQTYVETNSAYAVYMLSQTPEQEYGIYNFIRKASIYPDLIESAYYKLEHTAFLNGQYIGSPGIAMNELQDKANRFIFFDLDIEALNNIDVYAKHLSLSEKVTLYNQDSVTGVMNMLQKLPVSTLIHIDPYEIDKPAANGKTYMDVFTKAATAGLKCVFWYGFNTLNEKEYLNNYIRSAIKSHSIEEASCTELIMKIIKKDSVLCNPGILGSGLLTANLSKESLLAIATYSELLVDIYKGVNYLDFNGDLYRETVEL